MDILFSVAALITGFILLEAGAGRFTGAIGAVARRLHASEGTVGLLALYCVYVVYVFARGGGS